MELAMWSGFTNLLCNWVVLWSPRSMRVSALCHHKNSHSYYPSKLINLWKDSISDLAQVWTVLLVPMFWGFQGVPNWPKHITRVTGLTHNLHLVRDTQKWICVCFWLHPLESLLAPCLSVQIEHLMINHLTSWHSSDYSLLLYSHNAFPPLMADAVIWVETVSLPVGTEHILLISESSQYLIIIDADKRYLLSN